MFITCISVCGIKVLTFLGRQEEEPIGEDVISNVFREYFVRIAILKNTLMSVESSVRHSLNVSVFAVFVKHRSRCPQPSLEPLLLRGHICHFPSNPPLTPSKPD